MESTNFSEQVKEHNKKEIQKSLNLLQYLGKDLKIVSNYILELIAKHDDDVRAISSIVNGLKALPPSDSKKADKVLTAKFKWFGLIKTDGGPEKIQAYEVIGAEMKKSRMATNLIASSNQAILNFLMHLNLRRFIVSEFESEIIKYVKNHSLPAKEIEELNKQLMIPLKQCTARFDKEREEYLDIFTKYDYIKTHYERDIDRYQEKHFELQQSIPLEKLNIIAKRNYHIDAAAQKALISPTTTIGDKVGAIRAKNDSMERSSDTPKNITKSR